MLRSLRLGLATVALLTGCSAGHQAKVVCEYRDTLSDGECRWAAHAVLDSVGATHSVSVIVVYEWPGCIYCPLFTGPMRRGALIFVRFSDGAPSIVRDLSDLSQKRPLVSEIITGFDTDDWIDAAQKSHGTSVTSIAVP